MLKSLTFLVVIYCLAMFALATTTPPCPYGKTFDVEYGNCRCPPDKNLFDLQSGACVNNTSCVTGYQYDSITQTCKSICDVDPITGLCVNCEYPQIFSNVSRECVCPNNEAYCGGDRLWTNLSISNIISGYQQTLAAFNTYNLSLASTIVSDFSSMLYLVTTNPSVTLLQLTQFQVIYLELTSAYYSLVLNLLFGLRRSTLPQDEVTIISAIVAAASASSSFQNSTLIDMALTIANFLGPMVTTSTQFVSVLTIYDELIIALSPNPPLTASNFANSAAQVDPETESINLLPAANASTIQSIQSGINSLLSAFVAVASVNQTLPYLLSVEIYSLSPVQVLIVNSSSTTISLNPGSNFYSLQATPEPQLDSSSNTIILTVISSFFNLYSWANTTYSTAGSIVTADFWDSNGNQLTVSGLSPGINIYLPVQDDVDARMGSILCVAWSSTLQDFSPAGCTKNSDTTERVLSCTCTHASDFVPGSHPLIPFYGNNNQTETLPGNVTPLTDSNTIRDCFAVDSTNGVVSGFRTFTATGEYCCTRAGILSSPTSCMFPRCNADPFDTSDFIYASTTDTGLGGSCLTGCYAAGSIPVGYEISAIGTFIGAPALGGGAYPIDSSVPVSSIKDAFVRLPNYVYSSGFQVTPLSGATGNRRRRRNAKRVTGGYPNSVYGCLNRGTVSALDGNNEPVSCSLPTCTTPRVVDHTVGFLYADNTEGAYCYTDCYAQN